MSQKNLSASFECGKCPKNNDPERGRACVMWWEFIQTEVMTGKEQLTKMCGYQALPIFLTEVIKASNRPAAEISAMRCEMDTQMSNVASGMRQVPQMLANLMVQHPAIEHSQ